MSISVREACLEEGSILNLIRDYFEVAGHAECLISLEGYFHHGGGHSLPLELAALREMSLAGKWDQVIKYLDAFNDAEDKEGLKKSRYAAHKQKYLEILYHVETDIRSKLRLGFNYYENGELLSPHESEKVRHLLETQLEVLESLSPSHEEYQILKTLLSLPSIAHSKDFSTWNLQSGRLDTLYRIGEWVTKILFLPVRFPLQQMKDGSLSHSPLLRLVAKGLLYEQCERLCKTRCGEREMEGATNMLDLGGWIQQQPDSSFQLSPTEISLTVIPWENKLISSKPHVSLSVDMEQGIKDKEEEGMLPNDTSEHQECLLSTVNPQQLSFQDNKATITTIPPADGNIKPTLHNNEVSPSMDPGKEEELTDNGDVQKPQNIGYKTVIENKSSQSTSKSPPALEVLSSSTDHSKGRKEVKGSVADEAITPPLHPVSEVSFLPSTTPLFKTGRDSSTPKNIKSSIASLKTSPPPSPIAPANLSPQPKAQVPLEGLKKRIDFSEYQKWPKVSLLSTLSDSQVVRSIAFSGSGKIVAVGANSKTLRLCYTSPLLERKACEELDVFYQYPHYHKSSIYCLAWLGDTLLASGSNDHSIRLLTCSDNTSELKVIVQKPFSIHKGTIREIVFTPEGLLASGGGGESPEIQVTDVRTFQPVLSLSGHTSQVLSLGILPGGLLASGGQDNYVLLWDLRTPRPVSTLSIGSPVASLTSLRDTMTTSHLDGSCSLHDLNTFRCLSTYAPHTKECRTVRHCPKARHCSWVLSGSYDGNICLADISNAAVRWTKLCHHTDKVIQCRWHPEGKLFASTGTDKKAKFWSID